MAQYKKFTSVAAQGKGFAQAVCMTVCKAQDDGHVFALGAPDLDGWEQWRDLGWMLAAHELIKKGEVLRHGRLERGSDKCHKTVVHRVDIVAVGQYRESAADAS
jgi:hypothetical protein